MRCSVVLDVPYKRRWCTVDLCSAQPCVESRGVKMCPFFTHYRLSPRAAFQRDGPGWGTSRRFATSQSVINGCRTMFVNNAIYFPSSIILLWNTCIDWCYLFRSINHSNGIKASMCVHHNSLAAVPNNKY